MPQAALPNILVVDDNHDNADIVRQYLEAKGYPVTAAYSGEEALSLFETIRPSIVVTAGKSAGS